MSRLDSAVKMTLVLAILIGCLTASAAAQDVTPLPEPSLTFSCDVEGRDYYPIDIAFASDGTLYSSDAQLPLREPLYSEPGTNQTPDLSQGVGRIYAHTGNGCEAVFGLEQKVSVFGMSDHEGEICFAWHLDEGIEAFSKDETERFARVSCLSQDELSLVHTSTTQVALLGDLTSSSEGLWLSFRPIDLTLRVGLTGFLEQIRGGQVKFINSLPIHFLEADASGLIMSLFLESEENSSYTDTNLIVGDTPITLNMKFSSGVLELQDHILVADYRTGQLQILDAEHKLLTTFTGLIGPMGMTLSPDEDVCIAEMLGGRVSCYDLNQITSR